MITIEKDTVANVEGKVQHEFMMVMGEASCHRTHDKRTRLQELLYFLIYRVDINRVHGTCLEDDS